MPGWSLQETSGRAPPRATTTQAKPQPRAASPERIRRHYYLEARGLSLSGQRVSLQARRVWARILGRCINFKLACCLAQPRGLPFFYNTQAVASRFLNSCWDDTDDRHLPAREVLAGRFPPSSVSTPLKKIRARKVFSKCAMYAQVELMRRGHYVSTVCNEAGC